MKWKVTLIVLVWGNECLKACVTVGAKESHRVLGGRKKGPYLCRVDKAKKCKKKEKRAAPSPLWFSGGSCGLPANSTLIEM